MVISDSRKVTCSVPIHPSRALSMCPGVCHSMELSCVIQPPKLICLFVHESMEAENFTGLMLLLYLSMNPSMICFKISVHTPCTIVELALFFFKGP